MPTWEVIVHGRVQGVGFRWFAQKCAWQCGITGYAKNLHDGTVKIIASGQAQLLDSFCELIRSGTRHALVQSLDVMDLNGAETYNDFEIR